MSTLDILSTLGFLQVKCLHHYQFVIQSLLLNEIQMRSMLRYTSILHYSNFVSPSYSGHSMGNKYGCTAFLNSIQNLL